MFGFSSLKELAQRIQRWFLRWKGGLRTGLYVMVFAAIAWQLTNTGWSEVWRGMPVHPMFYVLQVALFALLPAVEVYIYRPFWPLSRGVLFGMLLRKRVFNEEIAGYSGEANLLMDVRASTGLETRPLIRTIRDVAIVSAMSANVITLLLLGVVLALGWVPIPALTPNWSIMHISAAACFAALLLAVLIRFRASLYAFSFRETLRVGAWHTVRFFAQHALMVVQWAIVVPDTAFQVWILYITVWVLINRLPFLPGKDLLFVSAGIPLAGALGDPTADLAAMWVVSAVLNKVMSLGVLVAYRDRKRPAKKTTVHITE